MHSAATKLTGEYNAEDIRTILHDLGTALVHISELDIDGAAYRHVEADYRETLVGTDGDVFLPIARLHSAWSTRKVQEETGATLKEARDAVRRATAKLYRNIADNALRMLAMANTDCPSYAERAYVDAVEHRYVMQNMHAAAGEPPF